MPRIRGKTGSLTLDGHDADFASIDGRITQPVEETTNYNDVGTWSSNIGSGITTLAVTSTAFLRNNEADSDPGFDNLDSLGAAAVFTLDTGATLSGNVVLSEIAFTAAKTRAAVGASFQMVNAGAIVKAWDITS